MGAGAPINYMVVERSAVTKFDKHVASRVFSPDELENLDSYMMKHCKYGIVELLSEEAERSLGMLRASSDSMLHSYHYFDTNAACVIQF